MKRALRVVVAVLALFVAGRTAVGQVAEDRARLVVNAGGPAARVWKLAFSPDSRRLYAAGADKVVHLWHVRHDLNRRNEVVPRAVYVKPLRWELSRGNRGAIFAMDVAPATGVVAVGGMSARQGGDVILFDPATGEIDRALPPVRNLPDARPGHLATVVTAAFSPDGTKLVTVDKSGETLLWSAPGWTPTPLRQAIPRLAETQLPALFLDNRYVVVGVPDAPNAAAVALALYDASNPNAPPAKFASPHATRVTALGRAVTGQAGAGPQWASSDRGGTVFLWNGANPQQQPVVLRRSARVPTALAFGPNDRLAVASELDTNHQTVVEIWSAKRAGAPGAKPLDEIETSKFPHNPTVAFSPDGDWFAAHEPESQEILLFSLRGRAGGAGPVLAGNRPLALRSRGAITRSVVFEKGPSLRLGMSESAGGAPRHAFDLGKAAHLPVAPRNIVWQPKDAYAGGWTLTPTDPPRTVLDLRGPGGAMTIRLDRERQGRHVSHAWIPDAQGRTAAVAIGTDEQDGVFVYGLPARPGNAPRLLRYFRDHNGAVLSLAASEGGRFLASSSEDQTVKVWSLAALFDAPPRSTWGTNFAVEGNQVVVRGALGAGIIAGRGIKDGDIVAAVRLFGQPNAANPQAILTTLNGLPLFSQATLEVVRGGQKLPDINIVPAWEPLTTLFVDRRNEWALWTPQGFYDSSVAEGDELFGWQINRGPGTPPRVVKAENLRGIFENHDLMKSLFATGGLQEAFPAVGMAPPADLDGMAGASIRTLPEVTVVSPGLLEEFNQGALVPFRVEARLPAGASLNGFEVRAYADGVPLGDAAPVLNAATNSGAWSWSHLPARRYSRYQVKLEAKPVAGAATGLRFSEAFRPVTSDAKLPGQYRMHVVAFAASKYKGGAFGPLRFPIQDVRSVITMLKEQEGTHYSLAGDLRRNPDKTAVEPLEGTLDVHVVTEDQANKESAGAMINLLGARLKNADPNDLLVILAAGHGFATTNDFYFVPINVGKIDEKQLADHGIAWSMIREKLIDFRCRKLILLDTCRSGNIVGTLETVKAAVRPLKQAEWLVLSATGTGADALENTSYSFRGDGGHGAFTQSLLLGLDGGADSKRDGDVSFEELAEFVKTNVPVATGDAQFPVYTPPELIENFNETPFVSVKAKKAE